MARRPPAPPPPQPAILTVEQMKRGIIALQRRIADLAEFDPQKIQQRDAPEVTALEKSIEETLANVFGHNTVDYRRYRAASDLDNGPRFVTMSSGWTGNRGPRIEQFGQYLSDGKKQSLLLLGQAVRGLEERIADAESSSNPTTAASEAPEQSGFDLSKVFVVHGHDGAPKAEVARFIEKLGFEPVILHERPNKGRTLITKFREEADAVGFAVVLMTSDDLGKALAAADFNPRARQNVVFELGFFIGKLGPERVAALVKGDIEKPSDFDGVVYISLDREDWQRKLAQELQEANYQVDWNKVMRP
jgi:predicted nucleotide-binding protein